MRRKRKKRNRLSVSLFPFLAVLICTLGVLIVMLVMAAKSADVQANKAQAEDDQNNQSQIDELNRELDLRLVQVDGMEFARPNTVSRLADSLANRSHIEDDIRELKKEFKRVGLELLELDRELGRDPSELEEFSEAEAAEELARLDEKIVAAKEELSQKRALTLDSGQSEYMIVPYKGSGGTFRRPIFIECTENAITLQPSGIVLDKREFSPPLEPGNMLDTALLVIREYWRRYDLAGEEGSAYPLIVIRPGGSETFVLARLAMKSWDDEFGYELVESGKKLDFGKVDPQLDAEVREAIEEARRRQQFRRAQYATQDRIARQQRSRYSQPGNRPGLTASGPYGGFVSSVNGRPGGPSESELESGAESGYESGNESGYESRVELEQAGQDGSSFVSHSSSDNGFEAGSSSTGAKSNKNSPAQSGQSQNRSQMGGEEGGANVGNPYADMSVAKQRGKNWALPTQTAGGTPYLRPIRVFCGPDYLEVRSFSGELTRIPMPRRTEDAIDSLVGEVWEHIDSWGIAGASSYWKPQLRFTVLAGGEQRFEQLKGLLFQSGILIKKVQP